MFDREEILKVEKCLKKSYQFRFNVIRNIVEYSERQESKFHGIDDNKLRSILRELQHKSFLISIGQLHDLLYSDFSLKHDPFSSFITSLPGWDKETDYINRLALTVKVDDEKSWCDSFKKWFVAMVATMIDPTVINHQCIVLVGPQGIGKSIWINKLVPEDLKEYFYSGTIDPKNKDTIINLSECFLINLDELENLTRHESGSLKELITKSSIRLRRPYGRINESLIRRASFIGSVNHIGFLDDSTGSRRFLCFETEKIDYDSQYDLSKIYSQAYHLYKTGFKFWFDGQDIQKINKRNQKFEVVCVEEELLLKHFEHVEKNSTDGMQTTEIFDLLREKTPGFNQLSLKKLGEILRKQKFERFKNPQNNNYVYAVRPRKN